MNALTELSLTSLAAGMRAGAFSSRDIVEACLRRIDALDPQLNAFLRVESEAAMIEAEACDRELAAGKPRGPRHGQIGRAHVCTPVTNAHLVCRLLLEKKTHTMIAMHCYRRRLNNTNDVIQ